MTRQEAIRLCDNPTVPLLINKEFFKFVQDALKNELNMLRDLDNGILSTGHSDSYTTGMSNGMVYAKSLLTHEEPKYFDVPTAETSKPAMASTKLEEATEEKAKTTKKK